MPNSKLFLIDAHALCYRAYFAIKELSTSYGLATNAVYGFVNTLKKILRDFEPQYMAVCFDSPHKTLRQEKYSEYKIHRPAMPDDLVTQIPLIKEVVGAFNLPIFEMEGFEADDIIATLAEKISNQGVDVVVVSDDKDMFQLIDDRVRIFSARKDMMIGEKEVKDLFGIEPRQITDYIGLAGDKTDNIPGVVGVGDVTARSLITQFGSLESILNNIDQVSSIKVKEKLLEQKKEALFSKELALLDHNVPVKFDLEGLQIKKANRKKLSELFHRFEFRRLSEEFSDAAPEEEMVEIQKLDKKKDFSNLITRLEKAKQFTFILREVFEDSVEDLYRAVEICLDEQSIYSVPFKYVNELKPFFENPKITKTTYDLKRTLHVLAQAECFLQGKVFDVMLAGHLLIPTDTQSGLGALSWTYLKQAASSLTGQEVKVVHQLETLLRKELNDKSLINLFEEIEIPLTHVLFRMEQAGVNLDCDFLNKMSLECDEKIKELLGVIYKLAGGEFNLNSPKQLSQVLFEKLKLPVIKKTKTGFSTNEAVLLRLADKHSIIQHILEYRQLAKLKSTYIDALPKLVNPATGRIHASFNQTGAETGRLSSNNPNLQNIPIRTELGRRIRKAFIPYQEKDWLISADYSQIELRILGHLANDKTLIKAFKNDEDIHAFTAALIFDVKENKVTPQMRDTAKRVNFGIVYGMSSFGLAKDLKISSQEAQEFINKYFSRYSSVQKFMETSIKHAEEKGYVVTILNRRRYIPEINSRNMAVQQFAQRQAINTPVQGSAADLIKVAMIHIQKELDKRALHSTMMITVHDELVFNVSEEEKEDVLNLVREQMEKSMSLKVPIKVTLKIGKNWLDTKKV